MNYTFIDIGCGTFDVSSDVYGIDVNGIFVEPIKQYLDVLPSSKTIKKCCAAICDYNGLLEMNTWGLDKPIKYYTKKQLVDVRKKVDCKNVKSSELQTILDQGRATGIQHEDLLQPKGTPTQVSVDCITLEKFFSDYNVFEVDHFKIDVEGYENVILKQLLNLMKTTDFKINETLTFECNDLSNRTELSELSENIANEFHFKIKHVKEYWNEDVVLIKK